MPPSYPVTVSKTVVAPSAKIFQDQLHDLITRLTLAGDHIKTWVPVEISADGMVSTSAAAVHTHNTTVHAESTARFITMVHEVMKSLQNVEATLKTNTELRQILQGIHVPYDLLELLDYMSINPDLYLRGLVNEATQQLVGLQRRKSALHLLSTTIENRLNYDDEQKRKHQPTSQQQPTTTGVMDADTTTGNTVSTNEVPVPEAEKNIGTTNKRGAG